LLVVMDSSLCKDIGAETCSLLSDLELREDVRIVIVCNKCDLPGVQHSLDSASWPIVHVSCITGAGIESLFDVIRQQIDELCPVSDDNALLSRQRHRLLIEEALIALEQVSCFSGFAAGSTAKVNDAAVVAELLRDATDAVGEVSGAVVTEQILDQIFSSFCIGK
uniref:MnmE_helical domain-containing protein n=1 Tax=Gongylonema pulchrum TaxID=637853 RepID=A0A183EBY4_9BILA